MLDVVDRFTAYHTLHGAWGSLHVVLDDGNVDDCFVRECAAFAEAQGDAEGFHLAQILMVMSKTQRRKLANLVAGPRL